MEETSEICLAQDREDVKVTLEYLGEPGRRKTRLYCLVLYSSAYLGMISLFAVVLMLFLRGCGYADDISSSYDSDYIHDHRGGEP